MIISGCFDLSFTIFYFLFLFLFLIVVVVDLRSLRSMMDCFISKYKKRKKERKKEDDEEDLKYHHRIVYIYIVS